MTGTSTQTLAHAKRIGSEQHENRDKESWHRQRERKKNHATN